MSLRGEELKIVINIKKRTSCPFGGESLTREHTTESKHYETQYHYDTEFEDYLKIELLVYYNRVTGDLYEFIPMKFYYYRS